MSTSANRLMLAELQSAIVRDPLVVTVETLVIDAIAEMSAVRMTCVADTAKGHANTIHQEARSSCVLVTEGQTLIGILTERDVVRLSAQDCPLHQTTMGEVVTSPVVTLQVDDFTDLFVAVNLLQQRQIRHLPILDRQNQILGVVTHESLQQLARPVDLLRLRLASEVMATHVVSAEPDTSMLRIARLMAEHRVGSVLLVNTQSDADGYSLKIPVGIITERDIVQFQALGLPLDRVAVQAVMSQPVFAVSPDTSLIGVQGIMERYAIRRVVVTGTQGELLGIVTQSTLLQALNPVELYSLLQTLEQRVTDLETEKVKLLENHTAELEQQVEQRLADLRIKAGREQLMAKISAKIAALLHLPDILDTTVQELRSFLGCDRVLIWQFESDDSGVVVAESVGTGWRSALNDTIADPCFQGSVRQHYLDGYPAAIENIHTAGYPDCYVYLLAMYQVKANLVVPIQVADQLWGLLIGHQCSDYRIWQPSDLTLLTEMAVQLAIAIQQAHIYQQVHTELAERQRTEAALQESESRFRSFMDSSPTAAWITDADGRIEYINLHYCQMLLCPTTVVGQSIFDLYPPEFAQAYIASTKTVAATGQRIETTEPGIRPDGSIGEFLVFKFPLPSPDGTTKVGGMAVDITDRKRAEAALRESNQRYVSLAEAAPVGIFRTDALGNCLYINDRWSQIVGLSLTEASGLGWVKGLHPQDRDHVSREWYRAAEEVRPFKLEYRFQRPDGSISWVYGQAVAERDAEGQVTGYVGTITDISDRKAAEEALSLSSERLNLALNATQMGLWDWSLITHEIIWSPLHEILWGYEPGTPQRTYQDWADRVHPHDVSRVEAIIQIAKLQQTDFKAEYRIIWPDGSLHWISAMGRFIFDHDQPIRMIGLVFDVSDRKATEQALQIQRDFNQLITEITSRFVDLHPEELDAEIDRTLQLIGEITQVETSYLFQYNELNRTASMTHEWCQPGCLRQMPLAQSIPSWDLFPWSSAKLMQRQVIHVPDVAHLPNEAALDQAHWQQHNLASILMIPLVQASAVTGAIGFASFSQAITWDDETIRLLQVMGQTIANAQERTDSEQQLYESAERLRLALASANQGLYDLNLQTGEALVSPEYATMLGYDPATFQETNAAWIERLHPDDQASVQAIYQAYIAGNLPQYQVECRQRTQAGDYKWVLSLGKIVAWDDAGNPLRMVGTHTDISDRKQAEAERFETEKLRLELTLLESILDIILAGYWDWDILNHQEYLSPGLKHMLGYEDDELPNLPETWQRLIFAEDLPGVLDCFTRHVQSHGAVPYYNEVRYHHKTGSTVWVICSGRVIDWDSAGNPLRMIGCHVDITTRKQSEEALRLSEERLQLALEAAGDGLWDWNVTTGDLYLSPQWLAMLGFQPGELPAHVSVWESLVHPDDQTWAMEQLNAHFQDASVPYKFDYRIQTKTGGYRWIANYGKVVVRDAQGRPRRMIGTHRDITASKQVEEQLRKSDAHLKTAQRIGQLGSWEFDINTQQISWSDEVFRIFGRDPAAGPPTFDELQQQFHPNDREHHQRMVQTAIATAQSYEMERRFYRPDGSLRFIQARAEPIVDSVTGQVLQLVGTVLDISDRKQAEQELRNLSDRLTLAVRSAAMGIWDWNVTENILAWDDRMYELYGVTPDQFTSVYDAWANSLHPDDRSMAETAIQQALSGEQDYEPEFRVVHPDGTIRFIKAYALVQRDDQGNPQRMIGINFDISDQKQAESRLLQTTAQLAASNRELEAFAYSVSHDLRSPLRAIDGFSKALLEDYGDQIGAEGQDYFDRIRHNVNRMGTLIDDLLRLSRVSRSEMRYSPVNLSALVQEQVNELQVLEPERQVTCVITPGLIVSADVNLMRVVISNLIQNAWKFTSHHATAQIEFGVIQLEGQPTYFVRDDGAGFDMAYTKMLFGVFQRLHNTHEFPGTGIGLATVQRVIHRHGGQVWAQGAIEQGATVYFTLPKTLPSRETPSP